MLNTLPALVFILLLVGFTSYSQDTLQTTEAWSKYNEYFVLHNDSTFEYTLKRNPYLKYYGVGTYTQQKRKLVFNFDSTHYKTSSYSCSNEMLDTLELKVISSFTHADISNYYFYIGESNNINGWNGNEALNSNLDSITIGHQQYSPITIYPKQDSCSCYWIELGFKNYEYGRNYQVKFGQITFRKKISGKKHYYKRIYKIESDMVYTNFHHSKSQDIPFFYTAPFTLKKH